jgi:hypothetical protein
MRVTAALPDATKGVPFGARIHAIATYLKTFQASFYERLQGAFADLFGLTISQGGPMNMLRRAQAHFAVAVMTPYRSCVRQVWSTRKRPGAHRRQRRESLSVPV